MASFRSQGSDEEEGVALARQLSAGNSNGTNRDVLGQIQRGHPSTSFYDSKVGNCLLQMAYIFPIIWCVNKITVDPLFLYILVIDDDNKCLALDRWISILSTFLGLLGIVINVVSLGFVVMIMKLGLLKKRFQKIIWLILLLIDLSTYIVQYLPYKQVLKVATALSPNMGRPNYYVASVSLVQYFVIVFLTYTMFTRATRRSATLAKTTLTKAAFNLLLYIHGGHVFGGLWYALAMDKEIESWTKACKRDASASSYCSWDDFLCDGGYGTANYTINYDFGIYYDAFKSGIVRESNVLKRILYCLRWGLQNLSGFGQNLQVSKDVWENIFVISVTIYGLVLFVFFVGNMQIYLRLNTQKSEKIRQKKKEIEISKSFTKLSKNLQKQIKRYQPDKWEETKDVHFENLFNNVPDTIKKNIKRELCLKILRTSLERSTMVVVGEATSSNSVINGSNSSSVNQVEEFRSWSAEMLDELCDCVKPISYPQYAQIIRNNSSVDEMLFLVHGKLQTYSLANNNIGPGHTNVSISAIGSESIAHWTISIDHLEDGMFCGEELIDWFRADPYSSNLPTSTKTIQTLTKVDAFALMSYDLQNFFIKHRIVSASTPEQAPPAESQPQTPVESQSQPVSGI